jgi:ribosomal protein L7Ae-like RNA K-turn-binding protein
MRNGTLKKTQAELAADPAAVWRLLGMAVKAGQAVGGAEAVQQALHRQKARLILVAADSSANTKAKYLPPGRQPAVPVLIFGSKAEMGHWMGYKERAVAAIQDQGFANRLWQLIVDAGGQVGGEQANTERL